MLQLLILRSRGQDAKTANISRYVQPYKSRKIVHSRCCRIYCAIECVCVHVALTYFTITKHENIIVNRDILNPRNKK
jgi:hypothetical protein